MLANSLPDDAARVGEIVLPAHEPFVILDFVLPGVALSLQFSRSVRALRLDSFRPSRIGLILAIANMMVLLGWFFFARVTLYEVSPTLSPADEGRVSATFSPEVFNRIQVGQKALVRLNAAPNQPAVALPAMVFDLDRAKNQAIIYPLPPESLPDLSGNQINGRVEIEVEYVTPLELVMRNSGRFLNQTGLQVGQPQPTQEAR
jgi:hypothetical protein